MHRLISASTAPFARQLAQGDGQIARGAFQSVGERFELNRIILRAHGDRRQSRVNLRAEAVGGRFSFLLGARKLRGSGFGIHAHSILPAKQKRNLLSCCSPPRFSGCADFVEFRALDWIPGVYHPIKIIHTSSGASESSR